MFCEDPRKRDLTRGSAVLVRDSLDLVRHHEVLREVLFGEAGKHEPEVALVKVGAGPVPVSFIDSTLFSYERHELMDLTFQ